VCKYSSAFYKDLGEEGKVKNDAVFHEYKLKKQKEFLSEFRALASTDVMSMFEQTSTSKLNADIKENMLARAKGVVKEGPSYSMAPVSSFFITLPSSSTFGFPLTASICPYALL
jgi:hypothetical protein